MDEHALGLLRQAYLVLTSGTFAFLVVIEGGNPDAPVPSKRWRHILRNLGLLVCLLAIFEVLIRRQIFDIASRLTDGAGLLKPLALAVSVQFVVGLLLIDLFYYLFHRLTHRWRWLWLIHAVHHSDSELDASTGVRFHPIESVISYSLVTALLLTLGLPLWVLLARAIVQNPIDLVQHANLRFPGWVERRLGWLLVTPRMHHVHHSQVPAETNSNYGGMLSIWDRIFDTYAAPARDGPRSYGLSKLVGDSWQSFGGMLLTPLRARRLGTL